MKNITVRYSRRKRFTRRDLYAALITGAVAGAAIAGVVAWAL